MPRRRERPELRCARDRRGAEALRLLQEVARPDGLGAATLSGRAGGAADRAFVDLHCHTSASFDSLATPASIVRAAATRGLTHLAITDHDRIDGALEARAIAPAELTVIIGQEIRTTSGDLIGVFLREAIPVGLAPADAIAAVRAQGGLVGMAHPFDRFRGSVGRGEADATDEIAAAVDWVEAWNARLIFGDGNARAAALAARVGKPGVAVSDSHTTLELGVAASVLTGDPSTPDGLRAALAGEIELVMGRGSAYARLLGPAAKLVQRARGRGRIKATVATR